MKKSLFVIFLAINTLITYSYCDYCPDRCICGEAVYDHETRYIVNCTDTKFNQTEVSVLQSLPSETEVLILTGNTFPYLPANIFGTKKNLSQLKFIDMTNDHIEEIKGKTFHHVPNVKRLILNHNSISLTANSHPRVFSNLERLEELHLAGAFATDTAVSLDSQLHNIFLNSNLTNLQRLHLEQNHISAFADRRIFCDLLSLQDVNLASNKLSRIAFDVHCTPALRFIDLRSNSVQRLPHADLAALDALGARLTVDLRDNPLVCDCDDDDLTTWLRRTSVHVRANETMRCLDGTRQIAWNVFNVTGCRLRKERDHAVEKKRLVAHYGFLVASLCLIFILVILAIKYTPNCCRQVIVPSNTVQYVVIGPTEDKEARV